MTALRLKDIGEAVFKSRELIDACAKPDGSVFPKIASEVNVCTLEEQVSLQAFLFIHTPYKFHWLCAGIGVGKSYILAKYVLRRVMTNWETVGLIAANTHDQLAQSTLPHLFAVLDDAVGEENYVMNKAPPKAWKSRNLFKKGYQGIISIKTGIGKVAHILTRTLNSFKAIRGITIGWAVLDEINDTKLEAFEEIKERLRCGLSHVLQLLVVGMPDLPGDNWTWEAFTPEDPEAAKMFKITFQASTEARHLNWEKYLKPLLMTLDPLKALQRIFARIVIDQSGRAYYGYQDGINNVLKYEYDEYRPIYFEIDFNILSAAPASATVRQNFETKDGLIDTQVLDEISLEGKTTIEVCNAFLEKYSKHKHQVWVFGDNTGNLNRTVSEFQHIKNAFFPVFGNRLKIPSFKSNPEVGQRVAAMNAMLCNAFGRARLFIAPHCKELIEDLRKLMPKDGKIDKSDAKRSHMSDALGYGIWFQFPPFDAKPGSREINAYV